MGSSMYLSGARLRGAADAAIADAAGVVSAADEALELRKLLCTWRNRNRGRAV